MPHPLGEALRATMRRWASGVTVVTSAYEGRRAGMTVSAFLSVSLEPPTILVSLHEGAETLAHLRRSGLFGVSILGASMEAASARFSGWGLPPDADRFEGSRVDDRPSGVPVLADAAAWLECKVSALHNTGTHVLVLGEVTATAVRDAAEGPLLYFDRAYRRLAT